MANRIETIFQKATEIESREERNEWLHAHFAAEPDLIVEVQRLLRAHDRADEWIDQPVIDQLVSHPSEPEELPCSTMLGPYRLLQVIGRGGPGVGYMGEPTEPGDPRGAGGCRPEPTRPTPLGFCP